MIGYAEQRNANAVYVFDEQGRCIFTHSGKLVGYTSTTVSVELVGSIYVLDEHGMVKYTK